MAKLLNTLNTLKTLGGKRYYYSLPSIEEQNIAKIKRLPVSIRIMLESLLRNCDGKKVREEDVRKLLFWNPKEGADIPFVVARVILQDFTGVPLLVDLAAMRECAKTLKKDPGIIEPEVPVDLVVDHSVQVDRAGTNDAFLFNINIEFERNKERYTFLKWGQEAFKTFKVVPPGIGIVHQVNLENIATVVTSKKVEEGTLLYLDTLVGTDSHTTMINGLGVLGWGVGGIEAEAAMLGQAVAISSPEVIGVHMEGRLKEGVTATDLTLRVTELLRKEKVVGKFVEFFGEGASSLSVADRATIGNMAPEYGATVGFFPSDEKTLDYLRMTGREEKAIAEIKEYLVAQNLFGIPKKGEIDYTKVLSLDLASINPSVAGPKRPQDRIDLPHIKETFCKLLKTPIKEGGYGKEKEEYLPRVVVHADGYFSLNHHHETGGITKINDDNSSLHWSESEMVENRPNTEAVVNPGYTKASPYDGVLSHGSVVIAAITSCTNTSNPSVMLAAGLLAKKAVEKGLKINPLVKTSLAPGSRVVTDYLEKSGLQKYLDILGFHLVAYGCTTCIGNSGPLDERIESAIKTYDLITGSVLSGNRNFEARINSAVKANFLMSPPLVVAFALAGRVDIDMEKEPLGNGSDGEPVYLKDIWPTSKEIEETVATSLDPSMFKKRYAHITNDSPVWENIEVIKSPAYQWEEDSTYIQKPPYFEDFSFEIKQAAPLKGMRVLAIFGDSVTTDHISPAGAFNSHTPAGEYLLSLGVKETDFNSYGSRRGNHFVMMRGTFANVRLMNKMAEGKEGGYTKLLPENKIMTIFEASEIYRAKKTPLIIFAGKDYGMGSSRDWAAKGTKLLGVHAVVAKSFERIHRSNLIGMGVLPLEFEGEDLNITGDEVFSLSGIEKEIIPHQAVTLEIEKNGQKREVKLRVSIYTPTEAEYYKHGGILPFMLRSIL